MKWKKKNFNRWKENLISDKTKSWKRLMQVFWIFTGLKKDTCLVYCGGQRGLIQSFSVKPLRTLREKLRAGGSQSCISAISVTFCNSGGATIVALPFHLLCNNVQQCNVLKCSTKHWKLHIPIQCYTAHVTLCHALFDFEFATQRNANGHALFHWLKTKIIALYCLMDWRKAKQWDGKCFQQCDLSRIARKKCGGNYFKFFMQKGCFGFLVDDGGWTFLLCPSCPYPENGTD